MPITKTQDRHPLYHDLKEVFRLSNYSIAVFCNSHPNSISYVLYKQRCYPKTEKKLYELHRFLKEQFPLKTALKNKEDRSLK